MQYITFFAMFGFKCMLFCLRVVDASSFLVDIMNVKLMLSWSFEWIMFLCLFRQDLEGDNEAEDLEHAEKLLQVKAVLEEVIISLDSISFVTS